MGTEFPWRCGPGTISANLDVIWGMSVETIDPWLRAIGTVFPLTYGAEAMREVMIRGGGWAEIWTNLAVLSGFSLAFLVVNVLALKKYRRL